MPPCCAHFCLFVCSIKPELMQLFWVAFFFAPFSSHTFTFFFSVYFVAMSSTNQQGNYSDHARLFAIFEGIGENLRNTDAQNQENARKLCRTLCAIWLSSKSAMLKDHVLAKSVKQPAGSLVWELGHEHHHPWDPWQNKSMKSGKKQEYQMLSMASFTKFHICHACQPLQATLSHFRNLTCINRTNDMKNVDCKSRLQIAPSNCLGTVQNRDSWELCTGIWC